LFYFRLEEYNQWVPTCQDENCQCAVEGPVHAILVTQLSPHLEPIGAVCPPFSDQGVATRRAGLAAGRLPFFGFQRVPASGIDAGAIAAAMALETGGRSEKILGFFNFML